MSDTGITVAPAIASEENKRGLSLPIGSARISASGRNMGTRINFHSDADGNPIGNISNLRTYFRETQGLKGGELTRKVESVWNQDEEKSRVYSTLSAMSLHAQGLRIGHVDINKAGTIGTVKYFKAKAAVAKKTNALEVSIAKAAAVEEAKMLAALNMQEVLHDLGVEKSVEECYELAAKKAA